MKYTKEELFRENKRLLDENTSLENRVRELNKELNNFIEIQQINIDLQVELKNKENENKNCWEEIHILRKQVETYEEVFELLKGKKE